MILQKKSKVLRLATALSLIRGVLDELKEENAHPDLVAALQTSISQTGQTMEHLDKEEIE